MKSSQRVWIICLPCLIAAISAHAKDIAEPLPAGIVFPGFAFSTPINPAGITGSEATVAQALYSPPIWGSSTTSYGGGLTYGGEKFGLSGAVANTSGGSTSWQAGGAFKTDSVSLGASATSTFGNSSRIGNPVTLALGAILGHGSGSGVSYAGVLNGLNGTGTDLTLGIGYGETKKYNIEVNLQLPPFDNLGSSGGYLVSIGAAVYVGIFGVSYVATTSATSIGFSHGLALMVKPFKSSYFSLQLDTANVATFGFNLVF